SSAASDGYKRQDLDMLHFSPDANERKAIKILNPISEDLSVMRTTLAPSMVNVIVRNLRRGNMTGKLFELAKVYIAEELPIKSFPEEKQRLCIGAWGEHGFFAVKGICECAASAFNTAFEYGPSEKPFLHPGMTAEITCDGEYIGYLGVLAPTIADELALDRPVAIAELDYDKLTKHAKQFKYVPLPKYAEVTRDLALVCGSEVTCGQITKEIYSACKYVSEVRLFDVYIGAQIGENKKSMAFSVKFTPKDEPIDDRIDGFVKKILNNLKFKLNIELR
ncbi:MAG: phenylalanine--tRNA ligase subunit beta, partial [Clostridia bacterium]|nr:phenylalanine--tRNA ligase subunit beta [Clostridia bacterium]